VRDWADHGHDVPGSEEIWIAVIGPDTPPTGSVHGQSVAQEQIAATLLQFFGLERDDFNPHAGPPLPGAFAAGHRR